MENPMHKSDLNSYCQRINIPLPVYKTTFQGDCHALRFACTVSVGGKTFTSPPTSTFTNRKSAEQEAAKLALQHLLNQDESLTTNLRLYLRKIVCQDKARCKMILKEFVDKIKMQGCAYETVRVEKSHVFVSSLTLNGTCYRGECGKNKKEAEQLAALAAILSLLDDPTYATAIAEVIKSKFSACAVFNELKEFPNTRDCSVTSKEFKATSTSNSDVMPFTREDLLIGKSSFRVLVDEKKPTLVDLPADSKEEQGGSGILVRDNKQVLVNSLPQIENQVNKTSVTQGEKQGVLDDTQCVVAAGHVPGAVTISRCSYVPLPRPSVSEPQHVIMLPEATQPASQQIGVPTEFASVPAAANNPGNGSSFSSKRRRRKNKKKANQRLTRTKPASQQMGVPIPAAAAHNPCNDSIPSKKRGKKNRNKANKRLRAGNK